MVAQLALEFRVQFQRDVVHRHVLLPQARPQRDRRAAFTQPTLYKKIAAHPLVSALYTEKLVAEGTITAGRGRRDQGRVFTRARREPRQGQGPRGRRPPSAPPGLKRKFKGSTAVFQPVFTTHPVETGVSRRELLDQVVRGSRPCRRLQGQPEDQTLLDARAEAHKDGGPVDWGLRARRSPSARSCSKASPSASAARTASAAPSATATPSSRHRDRREIHPLKHLDPRSRRRSASTTRCSPRPPCSASTTATRSITRTCSASGRRSSATSPTARRSSSTSSSPAANRSGSAPAASCCSCRTATRARARALLRPPRALPPALRRGQHAGRQPHHPAQSSTPCAAR
jgi:hypothetical protein